MAIPKHAFMWTPLLASLLILGGCGGSDSSSSAAPKSEDSGSPTPPAATTVVVQPSLGLISQGVVELRKTDGTLLASENTGSSGKVSFSLTEEGPYLLKVCGSDGANYFDEGLKKDVPLATTQCLRSLIPDLAHTEIGITALTEALVRRLEQQSQLSSVTPAQIETAKSELANAVHFGGDVLAVPQLIGSAQELSTLYANFNTPGNAVDLSALPQGTDAAKAYAYLLSILAQAAADEAQSRAANVTAPAFDIADTMAKDLADGALDGQHNGQYIISEVYDIHQLNGHMKGAIAKQWADLSGKTTDAFLAQTPSELQSLGWNTVTTSLDTALKTTMPTPGDAYLSWQGSYTGTWTVVGPSQYDWITQTLSLPLYIDANAQVGVGCRLQVAEQGVLLDGVLFTVDYHQTVNADSNNIRKYTLHDQWGRSAFLVTKGNTILYAGLNTEASINLGIIGHITLSLELNCTASNSTT